MVRPIVMLLAFAGVLFSQQKTEIEQYRLPNGMYVILHPDHTAPLVHLHLRFDVGSKHEGPGRSGFAHLFEHLMYEGATGTNAHTYADCTDYHETVPAARGWSDFCGWYRGRWLPSTAGSYGVSARWGSGEDWTAEWFSNAEIGAEGWFMDSPGNPG